MPITPPSKKDYDFKQKTGYKTSASGNGKLLSNWMNILSEEKVTTVGFHSNIQEQNPPKE
jgi:hypothetical protein